MWLAWIIVLLIMFSGANWLANGSVRKSRALYEQASKKAIEDFSKGICQHDKVEPVETLTGEIVAHICLLCDRELSKDFVPPAARKLGNSGISGGGGGSSSGNSVTYVRGGSGDYAITRNPDGELAWQTPIDVTPINELPGSRMVFGGILDYWVEDAITFRALSAELDKYKNDEEEPRTSSVPERGPGKYARPHHPTLFKGEPNHKCWCGEYHLSGKPDYRKLFGDNYWEA
jgi:hypothetical protein